VTRITGTSHEYQYTFMTVSCSVLRRIKIFQKGVQKIKTHILGFSSIVSFMR